MNAVSGKQMKYKVYLLFLLTFGYALSGGGMETNAIKPDFSGTWKLDVNKSSLQTPLPKSMIFVIDHREPIWVLERTLVNDVGENVLKIELTTDGKQVVRDFDNFKSKSRLYWENVTLIFDSEVIFSNETGSNVVRYSLTDNGKTFLAEETFKSKSHSHFNQYVFNKQ